MKGTCIFDDMCSIVKLSMSAVLNSDCLSFRHRLTSARSSRRVKPVVRSRNRLASFQEGKVSHCLHRLLLCVVYIYFHRFTPAKITLLFKRIGSK